MKNTKIWLFGLAFMSLGYIIGHYSAPTNTTLIIEKCQADHSKDYQVACVLSDICRMAMDYESLYWREATETGDFSSRLYAGFEELYYDVIQNLDTYGVDNLAIEDFDGYVWAY